MLNLAKEIVAGKRLTREDDLSIFLTCDLEELCEGADYIRKNLCGNYADLCSIINAKSGKCPENCKYCAQSVHNDTGCEEYGFVDEREILKAAKENEAEGVRRFSIVTSGRALTGEDFEKSLRAFEKISAETSLKTCASMGFLSREQLEALKNSGVSRYHHNIETSKRNFPNICTTHTYAMKMETLKIAREVGLEVCSGGIIGLGETWEDRLDMAISLAEAQVDSIPINALMPIKGSPLENNEQLSEDDIRRTFAFFRYINPTAFIRMAAGRGLATCHGKRVFQSGANSVITGNMLTTSNGSTIKGDIEMLASIGFNFNA